MANDPKTNPDLDAPKPSEPSPTTASDQPASADPKQPAAATTNEQPDEQPAAAQSDDGANPPSAGSKGLQPEPLADGTVPTVLKPGASQVPIPKSKVSLRSVYRRADIMTTLITFVVAVVAAGASIGVYLYITRAKAPTTKAPTVTTLDKTDLQKLGAFFEGNAAGSNAQVLTINASTFFKNRVAISSDLKVISGLDVSGSTTLADLTVNKTSTLGVTNVRGALSVDGPLTVQNPALFNAGGSFKGNVAATGNGSFGGSLSAGTITVTNLSVSGTFNLNGHLSIGGSNPSAAPATSQTQDASISGTDASGTVTITIKPTGPQSSGLALVTVNFRASYPRTPTVVITPIGRGAAILQPYITATASSFTIGAATVAANGNATSYSFNYWVTQ